jgi:aldehyde:ferredoxin oxidoreductase
MGKSREWYGWAGRILIIDLTKEMIYKQPLSKAMAYGFLGGRGFNAITLWNELKPGIDPLHPDNVLCIGVGPLNGTLMPMSGRFNVSCKSPLTGILGDGNLGGHFGAELKFAGYDQIVVKGKAKKPVYLYIRDDEVEIKSAEHLWRKTTWETEEVLKNEHGRDVRVCCIGQAGENLVRSSTTIADMFRSGSPGSGAVWGSKNLKAIVVKGTKEVKIAKPDEFLKLVEEDQKFLLSNEYIQGTIVGFGTPGYAPYWFWDFDAEGLTNEEAKAKLGGEELVERYMASLEGCFNCLSPCGRLFRIIVGRYAGTRGKVPEGGAIITLGFYQWNLKWPVMLKINNLCNQYSLNTYPVGDSIKLAIELYERGIITKKDTDGMELKKGDEEIIIELIHKIALREGFGNLLAEGPLNFAKRIGKGAEKLYPHTYGYGRGAGYIGHMAIAYMTSTRGADHLRGVSERYPPALWKGRGLKGIDEAAIILGQHEWCLADSLERCKCAVNTWAIGNPLRDPVGEGRAKMVAAVTGWNVTPREMDLIAERIYNVERAFNVREGACRKYDQPPEIAFEILKGILSRETCDKILDNYYRLRGWDIKTGIPLRKKLEELGLGYVADELEANIPYPEWNGPPLWPLDKYPHGGERAKG